MVFSGLEVALVGVGVLVIGFVVYHFSSASSSSGPNAKLGTAANAVSGIVSVDKSVPK